MFGNDSPACSSVCKYIGCDFQLGAYDGIIEGIPRFGVENKIY